MGFVKDSIEIVGINKSKTISALFDSGAYRTYIRKEFTDGESVDDIGFHIFEGVRRVILANSKIEEGICVRFKELKINGKTIKEPQIIIMDNLVEDAIIGALHMQKLGVKLDIPNEKINLS
ncbi:MAG: aspartyl protease family protein [Candidatus Syntropharchaeia archaeon]